MSRFHEEKYKRWSDPNLYNSCFYCTPMLEEEIVPSLYPSELSSQLFSTTQKCVSYRKTSSNYCLCRKHCDEKMKSYDSQSVKKLKCLKCQESEKIRENLELHLTGTQIEESLAEDRQAALLQHLNLSITALEALAQYGQSLQVSQLAACRVLNISHLLTLPQSYSVNSKSDSLHLTMHLQQLEEQKENKLIILQDLIEHCSKFITLPKHFNELMNNHYIKKKDFYTATKNFKNFLTNFTLSISELEKLHQQYDDILNNYQQSRCVLDLELPKVINIRLMALCDGFERIKKYYNNTDNDDKIVILFKSIGEKLHKNDTNTVTVSHDEDSPKPKLCQKCKINYVNNDELK